MADTGMTRTTQLGENSLGAQLEQLLCERAGELRRMEAAVAAARAGVEAQQRDANRRDMAAAAAADQLHQRHTRVEHMEGACAIEREREREREGETGHFRPSRKQPAVMTSTRSPHRERAWTSGLTREVEYRTKKGKLGPRLKLQV